MATSFQQDLGGIETPANIEQPIVNQAAATAITGLGNAAHLKIAADNEDRRMELKSAGRGRDSLTQAELEAIDYPRLQAALDQGLLDQTGFQTRLDANLRRVYAAYPERQRAYSSFASSVRSTIVPEKDRGVTTEAEAIKKGQLEAIQNVTREREEFARRIGAKSEVAGALIAEQTRRAADLEIFNYEKTTGTVVAAQRGFQLLPAWSTKAMVDVLKVSQENNGTLPPGQIGMIKARALAEMDNQWNAFNADLKRGEDVTALRQAYDQRRASVALLIDQLDASKVSAANKDFIFNVLAKNGAEALPDLFSINQVGGQAAVDDYLKMQGNKMYADLIRRNNAVLDTYLSRTGGSPDDAWRQIALQLAKNEPLTDDQRKIMGQMGVNAIAGPEFNGSQDPVVVPQARKLVESGDVGIVRAWFTPNGLVKLRDPGENGDYYRKQYQGMIDSVKATVLTELSDVSGRIELDQSTNKLRYIQPLDAESGMRLSRFGVQPHSEQDVLGLGTASIQKKLDILSNYALKTPDIATGDSAASPREALSKVLEDINKRRASFNSPTPTSRVNPATTTTPQHTSGVTRIDDQGEVIQ